MKGGKNKIFGLVSDTETPPPPFENGISSENDVVAEEELAVDEKPKLAEEFYEIEAIGMKRVRKGKVQYLIKWRGWPETANTWEPLENLMTCYDVIDAFEESLLSGKQPSTHKRKRTHGVTHNQMKKRQQQQEQQDSPTDATYNVSVPSSPQEPVPSPPQEPVPSPSQEHVPSPPQKLVSLPPQEFMSSPPQEPIPSPSQEPVPSPPQEPRCRGSKRRKSASVWRYTKDTTSGVVKDPKDSVANGTSGHFVEFMQEEIHDHGFVGNASGYNNEHDEDTYAITEIIKPMKPLTSPTTNGLQEVSMIFLAKRSDGKTVMVDNKFLKMNDPLLLINFYEQHIQYHPSQ